MSNINHSKVLILGSGPAGYTAAIYTSRAMLEPVLLTGIEPGGQMTITTDVENYPGFSDVIQGPWLMEQMRDQAEKVGTKIILDTIVDVDLSVRPFILSSDSEKNTHVMHLSFLQGLKLVGLVLIQRINLRVTEFQLVLHVMVFSIKIKKLWLLVEEIQLWKRLYF